MTEFLCYILGHSWHLNESKQVVMFIKYESMELPMATMNPMLTEAKIKKSVQYPTNPYRNVSFKCKRCKKVEFVK